MTAALKLIKSESNLLQRTQTQDGAAAKQAASLLDTTAEYVVEDFKKIDQLLTNTELTAPSPLAVMRSDGITTLSSAVATNLEQSRNHHPKLTEFINRIANGGKMSPTELLKIESDWR